MGDHLHRQLIEAARIWYETGRDPDALYRGARPASRMFKRNPVAVVDSSTLLLAGQ